MKKDPRQERIYNHAQTLFFTTGFRKISVDVLVKQARVSKTLVYDFFESKEKLVELLVLDFTKALKKEMNQIMNDSGISTAEKFTRLSAVRGQKLNQIADKFWSELKVFLPDVYQKWVTDHQKMIDSTFKKLINQVKKSGFFKKEFSTPFLLELFLKVGEVIYQTDLVENVDLPEEKVYQHVTQILLFGSAKKETSTAQLDLFDM